MAKKIRDDDLRVRLNTHLKDRVDALFARKKISQTEAVEAMLEWLLKQPDLLQSVVLGQVNNKSAEDVLKLMLETHGKRGRGKQKKTTVVQQAAQR